MVCQNGFFREVFVRSMHGWHITTDTEIFLQWEFTAFHVSFFQLFIGADRPEFGISLRYADSGEAVEKLISFVECKSVTGSAICNKILSELKGVGLDPKNCRVQAYDGTGSMSGRLNGCQAKLAEVVPEAQYCHCASHQLNLALTKACSVKAIQCMLSDLQALGIFFKYSPKRQRCLETCTACLNYRREQERNRRFRL